MTSKREFQRCAPVCKHPQHAWIDACVIDLYMHVCAWGQACLHFFGHPCPLACACACLLVLRTLCAKCLQKKVCLSCSVQIDCHLHAAESMCVELRFCVCVCMHLISVPLEPPPPLSIIGCRHADLFHRFVAFWILLIVFARLFGFLGLLKIKRRKMV